MRKRAPMNVCARKAITARLDAQHGVRFRSRSRTDPRALVVHAAIGPSRYTRVSRSGDVPPIANALEQSVEPSLSAHYCRDVGVIETPEHRCRDKTARECERGHAEYLAPRHWVRSDGEPLEPDSEYERANHAAVMTREVPNWVGRERRNLKEWVRNEDVTWRVSTEEPPPKDGTPILGFFAEGGFRFPRPDGS